MSHREHTNAPDRQAVDALFRMLVEALARLPKKSCQPILAEILEGLPSKVAQQRQRTVGSEAHDVSQNETAPRW
jgi:hypothetical protein